MSDGENFRILGKCSCPCHPTDENLTKQIGACSSCKLIVCKQKRILEYLEGEEAKTSRKVRFLCFRPGEDTLFGDFDNMEQAVEHFTAHLGPGKTGYVVFDTGKFVVGHDEVSSRSNVGQHEGAGL